MQQSGTDSESRLAGLHKPWYKRPLWIALLVIFWPITLLGLPFFVIWYAWRRGKWGMPLKITVTVLAAGVIFFNSIFTAAFAYAIATYDPNAVQVAKVTPTPATVAKVAATPNQTAVPTVTATPKPTNPPTPTATPKPKVDTSDLNATVRNNPSAIELTNNEDKNWSGCSLKLNTGTFGGGGYTKMLDLPAKGVIVVYFNEFTKSDGTRFNTYNTEPQSLFIACNTPDRRSAYYKF